jgi:hypothetical protein
LDGKVKRSKLKLPVASYRESSTVGNADFFGYAR